MDDTSEKAPEIKVDGRENQALTRVRRSRMHGAQVDCGCGGTVNAPDLGAGEYSSAIAFLVQKNRRKSERCVLAFKGDPTLFLFSGVICPTPVSLSA